MTQYNSLNVKLSNSLVKKLKSAIKNESEVVLRLSLNMIDNSNDETNFPHELLLTNRQVPNLRKAFENHLSANIKLSKTQLFKMIQSGGFLGRLLGPLLNTGLPLIKNVIKPLAKSVLIPLGLTAAASAVDARIHKKILGSGHDNTIVTTSNNGMEDIIKIVKSLEDSDVLLKVGKGINRAGEGILRAGYGRLLSLIPPHPLTNFKIQKYQNKSSFNGVYSRDNLPYKIKGGAYINNLDEYSDTGTHWVALYVNNNDFDGK